MGVWRERGRPRTLTLLTAERARASDVKMQAAKARTAIDRSMITRENDTILVYRLAFRDLKGRARARREQKKALKAAKREEDKMDCD